MGRGIERVDEHVVLHRGPAAGDRTAARRCEELVALALPAHLGRRIRLVRYERSLQLPEGCYHLGIEHLCSRQGQPAAFGNRMAGARHRTHPVHVAIPGVVTSEPSVLMIRSRGCFAAVHSMKLSAAFSALRPGAYFLQILATGELWRVVRLRRDCLLR